MGSTQNSLANPRGTPFVAAEDEQVHGRSHRAPLGLVVGRQADPDQTLVELVIGQQLERGSTGFPRVGM